MLSSIAPECPRCAKPMLYMQTTPSVRGPARHSFACRHCEVDYTEVDCGRYGEPDRALRLNEETSDSVQ